MENSFEHIDALIAKFMAGEASPEEAVQLDDWKNASTENAAYFEAGMQLMQASVEVDVDAAWHKLNERLPGTGATVIPLKRRPVFIRVAAAVLLLAILGVVLNWLLGNHVSKPVVLMAANTSVQQTLPDGSKVLLNRHSEISYSQYAHGQRKVSLKGEAFFEVVHKADSAFVVDVNGILIKDIGTAFNVKAIPGDNKIEVFVEHGEVQFYSEDEAGLRLVAGEKASYDMTRHQFSKLTFNATDNTASYRNKQFFFKGTPLKEVVTQLNAVYDQHILLGDKSLNAERLSVIFQHEQLDSIVGIIAETLDLDVQRDDSTITLKRKAAAN